MHDKAEIKFNLAKQKRVFPKAVNMLGCITVSFETQERDDNWKRRSKHDFTKNLCFNAFDVFA